jgi:hypothetical protein
MAASAPGVKVKNAAVSTKRNGVFMQFITSAFYVRLLARLRERIEERAMTIDKPDLLLWRARQLTHINSADRPMVIDRNWNKFNPAEKTLSN